MKLIVLAFALATFPAMAQNARAQQSPLEQALSEKFSAEINKDLQDRAALIEAQRHIAELQKALDALKPPDQPK